MRFARRRLLMAAGVSVPAWAPTDLSGLVLWLKSDTGLYQDEAGTNPITAADQAVRRWADQSGANNHAIASVNQAPLYKTGRVNGKPGLLFDGTDDFLLTTNTATYRTVFVVAKYASHTFANEYKGILGGSGVHILNAIPQKMNVAAGTDQVSSARRNGTALTWMPGTGGIGYPITPLDEYWALTWVLSADKSTRSWVGRIDGANRTWSGDICEIIAYNTTLSDADRDLVESYLATRYGITIPGGYGVGYGSTRPHIVFDGNSMTGLYTMPAKVLTGLGGTWTYYNAGVGSQTITNMLSDDETEIAPKYSASRSRNVCVVWEGTNAMSTGGETGTTYYNKFKEYCQARKSEGWQVIAVTTLPATVGGSDPNYETYRTDANASIRANAVSEGWADAVADVAADSRIGDAGDQNDTTYYSDAIHLTPAGDQIVADAIVTAIQGLP